MPDYFEEGFFVRKPAWHKMETVVQEYPGRERAMELAGHAFNVIEAPIAGVMKDVPSYPHEFLVDDSWKMLIRDDKFKMIGVVRKSYEVIPNSVLWDIVDALVGKDNVKYETAGILKGGSILWVLARIDEPVQVWGDNSPIYPYINVSTAHDYSAGCRALATSVRVVCWNTYNASISEAEKSGLVYMFRHTKNVKDKIEDAKEALGMVRDRHREFMELANELARKPVTEDGVKDFIREFIPDPPADIATDRAKKNIEEMRAKVYNLLDGESIPNDHRRTAYGLFCAGVEYLDHLRGYRSPETYFRRTIYDISNLKPKVARLAMSVAK